MNYLLLLAFVSSVYSQKYHYAIDLYNSATYNDLYQLRQGGYEIVFISTYDPTGNGQYDNTACNNLEHGSDAHLGLELYMAPSQKSNKPAAQQAQEVVDGLKRCNLELEGIWLQVVEPSSWPASTASNRQFIQQLINAFQKNDADTGIFTSDSEWKAITGDWNAATIPQGLPRLWYHNVTGFGPKGETAPNFDDFKPFSGWTVPEVKQFAQVEQFTNVAVKPINRDVYVLPTDSMKKPQLRADRNIHVGGNFKKN